MYINSTLIQFKLFFENVRVDVSRYKRPGEWSDDDQEGFEFIPLINSIPVRKNSRFQGESFPVNDHIDVLINGLFAEIDRNAPTWDPNEKLQYFEKMNELLRSLFERFIHNEETNTYEFKDAEFNDEKSQIEQINSCRGAILDNPVILSSQNRSKVSS